MAVTKPGATVPITVGGSVAVGAGFLLSEFPHLYDIKGRPLNPYIKENRGVLAKPNAFHPRGPPEPLKPTADHVNCVVKCSLGIMYHMIRKLQQSPNTQIGRRFNALYATVRPGIQPPPVI